MLAVRHIIKLRIKQHLLDEHAGHEPPQHVCSPLIGQFSVINDAIITSVLNIPLAEFKQQLCAARRKGAEYIHTTKDGKSLGISAVTSLVPTGNPLNKHTIVPFEMLRIDPQLDDHLIISAFMRHGHVDEGTVVDWRNRVDLIGWADMDIAKWNGGATGPKDFKTKLDVLKIPCRYLHPMAELGAKLGAPTCIQE